jgi:hypothetical protein
MLLILTQKSDGKKIAINPAQVKFFEVDSDGVSTHVVFGEAFVRVVSESLDVINKALGVTVP